MQIDAYTKLVLSVIGVSLATIALQGFIAPATAQGPDVQKVAICDLLTGRCARVGSASRPGSDTTDVLLVVDYSK